MRIPFPLQFGVALALFSAASCRPTPSSESTPASAAASVAAEAPSPAATTAPAATSEPSVINTVDSQGHAVLRLPGQLDFNPVAYSAGWLTIEAQFKPEAAASAEGLVSSGTQLRLTVTTHNVRQLGLQLDDASLPRGRAAVQALELDGKIFEITAKSGPGLHFVRTATTGEWRQVVDSPRK